MNSSYQRTPDAPRIEWLCDKCRESITGSDGGVWITYEDIRQAAQDATQPPSYALPTQVADLIYESYGPMWHITHDRCGLPAEAVDGTYYISIERIRDEVAVLSWTDHLMDKTWLHETDWQRVIRFAAGRR